MLNPSTFSNINNTTTSTSPILDVDNIFSYLVDDLNPNNSKQQDFLPNHVFTTSYYHHHHHLPSPSIYNKINYDNFLSNHELEFLQQSFDDSPILEEDDSNNKVEDLEIDEKVENNNVEMNHTTINSTTNSKTSVSRRCHVMKKKKKTSNKDRHSKIKTAHGLRERRMRLSLQVARPFFNLQDILGFDKGSRTLEWLLMQSKSSIEEIAQRKQLQGSGRPSAASGGGGGGDNGGESTPKKMMMMMKKKKGSSSSTCDKEDDDETKPKRTMTKEKRKVARERAKMRTLERMQSKEDYHGIGSTQLPLSSTNKLARL
ncbi:transcription factor TCP18-like [Spinacia oleracea]|uniref:Transcription factor TCP18-like n=1 Tax=Spinacia oleracea TaxID=3562 RepID=A0ABM3RJG5_SPIOL|nr:transcription factor TCP18-like [Spinacia oleracea]